MDASREGPTDVAGPVWQEGMDGLHPAYREWLGPPWWAWLVSLSLTGFLGVAFGAPYGARFGWVVFVVLQVAVSIGLLLSGLRIQVDERVLRAGRARLPLPVIASVRALAAQEARLLSGREADPRAFLALRTWATGRAVRVDLDDPEDPHPYWLVSTRHPDRVVAAIHAAGGAAIGHSEPTRGDTAAGAPAASGGDQYGTDGPATGQSGAPARDEEAGSA